LSEGNDPTDEVSMRTQSNRPFMRLLAFVVAQIWCTALALGMTWLVCQLFFHGRRALWIPIFMGATLLWSGTWGSWSSLVWSGEGKLGYLARVVTLLPALVVIAIGAALIVANPLFYKVGLVCVVMGAGILISAVLLTGALARTPPLLARARLGCGWLLFPILCAAFSIAIGALWFALITHPPDGDWRALMSLRTVVTSVMAIALGSTIIPGGCADLANRFGRWWSLHSQD
jgi:hypothetical protein